MQEQIFVYCVCFLQNFVQCVPRSNLCRFMWPWCKKILGLLFYVYYWLTSQGWDPYEASDPPTTLRDWSRGLLMWGTPHFDPDEMKASQRLVFYQLLKSNMRLYHLPVWAAWRTVLIQKQRESRAAVVLIPDAHNYNYNYNCGDKMVFKRTLQTLMKCWAQTKRHTTKWSAVSESSERSRSTVALVCVCLQQRHKLPCCCCKATVIKHRQKRGCTHADADADQERKDSNELWNLKIITVALFVFKDFLGFIHKLWLQQSCWVENPSNWTICDLWGEVLWRTTQRHIHFATNELREEWVRSVAEADLTSHVRKKDRKIAVCSRLSAVCVKHRGWCSKRRI